MSRSTLHKLREGWSIQVRVIYALMIRELSTRFGRQNIGFLWVMVEPLLFAGVVSIIWRLIKGPEEHGVSVIAFVVSGYIPITLFRHGVQRSVSAFTANGALLYHRQIKILDFILVRFVIEVLGGLMAWAFIGVILIYFDLFPVPDNIGLFIAGWSVYALFCFSICLVIAPLSETSEILEKFIPVSTYVMIPFSGLFYMVSWMTPPMREFLVLSPFVNGMEMMRKGIWGDKLTAYYNIWNPLGCSLVLMAVGLALCRHVRKNLAIE